MSRGPCRALGPRARGGATAGPRRPLSPVLLQENGRRQKQHLGLRFDSLYSILEERKKELLQSIAREQEEKVQHVRGLIRQYGDHLEASSKLVESAIQAMEEPQMAVYLQVCAGGAMGVQGVRTLWGNGAVPRLSWGTRRGAGPSGALGLPQSCVVGPWVPLGAWAAPQGWGTGLWSLRRIWGCPQVVL